MKERTLSIRVDQQVTVSARQVQPGEPSKGVFVYAPGAGSNLEDPFALFVTQALACEGIVTVRFQFPYQEQRKKRPDRNQVLEATWHRVLEEVRPDGMTLVVGGRSMGGRIASQVVAKGVKVDGLALFAYPLHSTARPDKWRDSHLAEINVPTLFCSGTRDSFAKPDELQLVSSRMARSSLHLLEGADHGFRVLKSSGRDQEEIWAEAVAILVKFHFSGRNKSGPL